MFVGLRMTKDPPVCAPDCGLNEAARIMERRKVRQLLVVENERLVGLLSKVDLQHALPSPATSLSVHEMNYLLSKLTVSKLMVKDVVTVAPETTIEEAALLMHDRDYSGLPVVRDGRVVGHINRTIMLEVFVEEMGLQVESARITLELDDARGVILAIAGIIKRHDLSIVSMATFFHGERGKRIVVFRVKTDDTAAVEADLKAAGYRIVTAADFGL